MMKTKGDVFKTIDMSELNSIDSNMSFSSTGVEVQITMSTMNIRKITKKHNI